MLVIRQIYTNDGLYTWLAVPLKYSVLQCSKLSTCIKLCKTQILTTNRLCLWIDCRVAHLPSSQVTVHLQRALHFRNSFQYNFLSFKLSRLPIILISMISCLSSIIFSSSTCPKHEHSIMSTSQSRL